MNRKDFLKLSLLAGLAALPVLGQAQAKGNFPEKITLDWGYYSPHTLLIKDKGWLEEAFADVGTKIDWVQSRGSNNSLEFLKVNASQFAGSASLSAFIARANGVPLKIIYIPNWGTGSQLIQVPKDSPLQTIADLKGKRVAVTKGTAPFFTLVRALATVGLTPADIRVVHLQHPEGFAALQQGQVDAFVGIDPHTSLAELDGARTLFFEPAWRSPSVFSSTEAFIAKYPEAVERVLGVWKKAQDWIVANPQEFATFVTAQTGTDPAVTELSLAKRDWVDPIPDARTLEDLRVQLPLIQEEGILRPGVDTEAVLRVLLDPAPATAVLGR